MTELSDVSPGYSVNDSYRISFISSFMSNEILVVPPKEYSEFDSFAFVHFDFTVKHTMVHEFGFSSLNMEVRFAFALSFCVSHTLVAYSVYHHNHICFHCKVDPRMSQHLLFLGCSVTAHLPRLHQVAVHVVLFLQGLLLLLEMETVLVLQHVREGKWWQSSLSS
ncbi:uncharacterized protein G2W53_006257 [Senna tora]|uniref:Uncharacterized protein n=1 Tax=Senna tora TaxID=362788 RepID=A0A834X4T6_9FABA|nr:uncharacterized protein G2W53_006257 [Senna tora]